MDDKILIVTRGDVGLQVALQIYNHNPTTEILKWDEEKRELRFADGKGHTKVPFRIIDGETGQVHSAGMTSDFRQVNVDVSWRLLSAPDP
jgi:hypothetical protein